MTVQLDVGFVGLGAMGWPMVEAAPAAGAADGCFAGAAAGAAGVAASGIARYWALMPSSWMMRPMTS